jgi:hypothetical protein
LEEFLKSLYKSYDTRIDKAYIIRLSNNKKSVELSERCLNSCVFVNMPCEYWEGYDGVSSNEITPPDHLKDHIVMKMIKISNHYMLRGEVACALSHISLWSKCLEIEKPIVILEHDAIMVNPYLEHTLFNSICYLGSFEQYKCDWGVNPTPLFGSEGPNYLFICRAHAYSIDPTIARILLSHVLKYGIENPLDILIRSDIFPIHQMGLYAYDLINEETTIKNRCSNGRPSKRNDNLEV